MTDHLTDPPEDLDTTETVVEKPERNWDAEAREMGWKPQDEYDGDPDNWRDAETFVRKGDEIFHFVKRDRDREREKREKAERDLVNRILRLEGTYTEALKRQKAQHEAELKAIDAAQRKAVEEADTEAYDALKSKREALGQPPEVPQEQPVDDAVAEWGRENPWFYTDPQMRALAVATAGTAAQNGADVRGQITAAEDEVKRRFPDRFGKEAPKPSAVETGATTLKSKAKPKGVAQLPREAREAFDMFVRQGIYKKDDLPKYANSYWEQE